MKIIQNPTGTYSVKFKTKSGKTLTRNLKTKSKKDALSICKEAKIEEIERAAKINALTRDAVTSIIADRNISFQDCINEWVKFSKVRTKSLNTIYTQSKLQEKFANEMGIDLVSEVTEKEISDWVNIKAKIKINSREQRLSALSSIFSYAVVNCYIIKDPTVGVAVDASKLTHKQKETTSRAIITQEEYDKIISHAPYFMRQATMIGWWTGLRLVDICKLEWDSWSNDHLTVWTEKQDKRVQLPLDNPMIGGGILKKVLAEIKMEDKTYCFPDWAELIDDPKRRSRFSVYFGRFLQRMEIKGKSFHCLRHTFVTRTKLDFDSSLEKIAKWVGHSDTKTTKGYLHN